MKELRFKDINNNILNVSVIGFFQIEALEKEYVMYALKNETNNDGNGHVLLGEVVRDGDDIQVLGILPEEEKIVVAYYNEISKQLGGE